jgi:uncharacterized lipoprotein
MFKRISQRVAGVALVVAVAGCNPPPEAPRQKTIQEKLDSTNPYERTEGAQDAIKKYGTADEAATN